MCKKCDHQYIIYNTDEYVLNNSILVVLVPTYKIVPTFIF